MSLHADRVAVWSVASQWDGDAPALREPLRSIGWTPPASGNVVIQIGEQSRSAIVLETARTLVRELTQQLGDVTITVLDAAAAPGEWSSRVRDVGAEETFHVSAVAARNGLMVPQLWFESFSLITVAGAVAHPPVTMASVLDAQADALRRVGNRQSPDVLAYEAHRLAASDLCIACGYVNADRDHSARWWIMSASDVALEHALARACGVAPHQLPLLRELARHEILSPGVELVGDAPALRGHAAPEWQARMHLVRSRAGHYRDSVVHDATAIRRNLGKVPHFVRRQLAARAGRKSA